ncbi:MAG: hypothetical protein ACI9JN_002810 [Bacteroidia bacterium]
MIDKNEEIEIDRYVFPCKRLYYYFKFQKDHPASIENQIQAEAVNSGCDWCPNFNADNWGKLVLRQY